MCRHSLSNATLLGLLFRRNRKCKKCGESVELKYPVIARIMGYSLLLFYSIQDTVFEYYGIEYYMVYAIVTILLIFSPRVLPWKEADKDSSVCNHEPKNSFPFPRQKCVKCGTQIRCSSITGSFCGMSAAFATFYFAESIVKIVQRIVNSETAEVYVWFRFSDSIVAPLFATLTMIVLMCFYFTVLAKWEAVPQPEKKANSHEKANP